MTVGVTIGSVTVVVVIDSITLVVEVLAKLIGEEISESFCFFKQGDMSFSRDAVVYPGVLVVLWLDSGSACIIVVPT